MTRQEIESTYTVRTDGRIANCGKFEGELLYVPYYWNLALEGMFAEDINGVFFLPFDKDDRAMFPELDGAYGIGLEENDQGFVTATLFGTQADYNAAVERMEKEESDNIEPS